MSNFRETIQRFLKGIDRRVPPERTSPERPITLQNARLFKRGQTGFITRIKGFVRQHTPVPRSYDRSNNLINVVGEHDTRDYMKGYFLEMEDRFRVEDDRVDTDVVPQIISYIDLSEDFFTRFSFKPVKVADNLGFSETLFKLRTIPKKTFLEGFTFQERFTRNDFYSLSFTDSLQYHDRPLQ